MSKKSKKKNRRLPSDRKKSTRKHTATTAEFNPDYSYVKKDLRRIGTLAGTFFLVLIVLSFFLR